ncbi:hypothetical protein ACW5XW_08540 [Aeromonas piscicola]|uniref:Uncharacterized protein n=1 Tax=Aeromonas piscicola TaxID=600645 RepID=A0ABT7Q9C9_9GAMM|nr:hypothetical protein [Aeromonas piscicola]MDM5130249.1 hypothetical protein [Aeromonas piscicola]
MIKYSVMTATLIFLVSMLIAQSSIYLRHSLLRLMDELGSWMVTLIDPLGLFLSAWGS